MKIFVIGASGYIGKLLYKKAKQQFCVYGTTFSNSSELIHLSLYAPDNFDFELIEKNDVIFFTAAISAPDICSTDFKRSWEINVIGTSKFISNAILRGARVVFFASDTVYGEIDDRFDEQALGNPAGEYAAMKYAVEMQFLGNPLFKSIRLSYVFSKEDKFVNYLSGCAERGEEAELFHPFYRAIIHRDDVIEGVISLALRWDYFPQKVINFGGPELLSRIEFAEDLKLIAFPNLKYRVTEPGDEFFKNRPRVIAMSSDILPTLLGRPTRTLAEAARIEFVQS